MDMNAVNWNQKVHIHNFSFEAVQSLILEIKKFPITYNGNTRIAYSNELINIAWFKITTTLLQSTVNNDFLQLKYWERSFRELWKWMRSTLAIEMLERGKRSHCIQRIDYIWLVHLKFLEPYIQMSDQLESTTNVVTQGEPTFYIEVHSAKTVIDKPSNDYTIYWLTDSTEPTGTENLHISMRIQYPVDDFLDLHKKSEMLAESFQPTESDYRQIIQNPQDPGGLYDHSSSLAQISSSSNTSKEITLLYPTTFQSERTLGAIQSDSATVDEDYKFIMSFLPLLKREPNRNAALKMEILKAVYEIL